MKRLGFAIVALIAIVALAGCPLMFSVSGKVVNVRASGTQTEYWKGSTTLEGATITFRPLAGDKTDPITGTVGADGTFIVDSIPNGRYEVTGTQSGWVFIPRIVDVTGVFADIPPLLAYESASISPTDILIMVEWTNLNHDVDSYIIRDNDNLPDEVMTPVVGYNWGAGTYYTDGANKVFLERDVTTATPSSIPRVETVRITGNNQNPEFLRYYIRLYTAGGSLTGEPGKAPSDATVYVMQGTTHMGTFPIAYNTAEQTLGVVTLQLTDVSPITWNIGSFGGDWIFGGMKSITWKPVVVDQMW